MYSRYMKRILTIGLPAVATYCAFTPLSAKELGPNIHSDDGLQSAMASIKTPQSKTKRNHDLNKAKKKTQSLAEQFLIGNGYPGLVLGVSVKGVPVYIHGFGYANVETNTRCSKDTVMRIASISKPLTMLSVAKLVELGKIDLDKDIRDYLGDNFPIKEYNGKPVKITTKQLASHRGGIRHYKEEEGERDKIFPHYSKATDALEIFKHDYLIGEPGSIFHYSTYSYTVIAAVVESVLTENESFGSYLEGMCNYELGMTSTYLDDNEKIILNRAAQYRREGDSLFNAPYVDCSYKWAGGGMLSTAPDLLRFGNIMLYSYLNNQNVPGFLKKSTVETLWTPIGKGEINLTPEHDILGYYGLGWGISKQKQPQHSHCASLPFESIYYHTGAATGVSSLLLIIPEKEIVVVLLCNMENARNLGTLGVKTAEFFSKVSKNRKTKI